MRANKLVMISTILILASFYLLSPDIQQVEKNHVYANTTSEFVVDQETQYPISPGVIHTNRTLSENDTLEELQLMEIDPKNPFVELQVYSPNNEVSNQQTVGEMIKELENEGQTVVGGINGDFFSSVGVPSGLQITNGEIITSPSTIKTLMLVMPNDSVKLKDKVEMTALLETDSGESISINMINRTRIPSHTDHLFLYTKHFGESSRTPKGGVEVVVDAKDANFKLKAGHTVSGKVKTVKDTHDSLITDDQFVLSASGSKADWIQNHLKAGEEIHLNVSFNKEVNKAKQVISGNSTLGFVLLKDGDIPEKILDTDDSNNTTQAPRTILATKQGKLYVLSVDGRQAGHSDGLSLIEAAEYLQSIGMEQSINIDGGGSTAYYARKPGNEHPELINIPSDGHERPVGNGLMITTTAPKIPKLDAIEISDNPSGEVKIAPGSKLQFEAKGQDKFHNPFAINPKELTWTTSDGIGTINNSGVFKAGSTEGKGKIKVRSGKVYETLDITVTKQIDHIELNPSSFVIKKGKKVNFQVKAYDQNDNMIEIMPELLEWSTEGDVGTISNKGILQTSNEKVNGKIKVKYGELQAESNIQVGKSPEIEGFEDTAAIQSSEVRTVPGSVLLSLVSTPKPVRGDYAAKLTYDFTDTPGTSGAYIEFLNSNDEVGRKVEGEPYRLGMWVYGDGKNHWVRLGVTEGNGENKIWNLTAWQGQNWTGWKYVYANVPKDTVFPIKVRNVVIEEKYASNKYSGAGALYFDDLRAEYIKH